MTTDLAPRDPKFTLIHDNNQESVLLREQVKRREAEQKAYITNIKCLF